MKLNLLCTAAVATPTSPAPHSPRLGAGLIRRQPGSAGFLPILLRVRLGFASCLRGVKKLTTQDASVHFSIVNNIRKVLALYEVKCPLCRNQQVKNFSDAAYQVSHAQCSRRQWAPLKNNLAKSCEAKGEAGERTKNQNVREKKAKYLLPLQIVENYQNQRVEYSLPALRIKNLPLCKIQ